MSKLRQGNLPISRLRTIGDQLRLPEQSPFSLTSCSTFAQLQQAVVFWVLRGDFVWKMGIVL